MNSIDPVVDLTLRAAFGLLFGMAAVHKLRDVDRFRAVLDDYRLLPSGIVPLASLAVVATEVAIAATLWLAGARRVGFATAGLLLVGYALAMGVNLARGRRHLDCGCVGAAGREEISWWLVGRNGALALVAFVALRPVGDRALVWLDGITFLGALVASAGVYVGIDGLLANGAGYRRLRGAA